ncbi:MAG: helix-turn-helix domain-containing protein [Candidatus Lokiarchaeota archaeon]|nr:helix-turn-helix domain-containing protein [Candidatus Lokiarchaeota archaeon]
MTLEKSQGSQISLDGILEILGNPTRRVILSKLAKVPHSTSELHKALGISRQAVHSQLKILEQYNIIENLDPDTRGSKYKIKSNLFVTIDISPDYYSIKYNMTEIGEDSESILLKDTKDSNVYETIKESSQKIKFLGEKIRNIEEELLEIEKERRELLQKKECFIIELKDLMEKKYRDKLRKEKALHDNLEMEIFYTLFFNTGKFHRKINIDKLLDELFFTDLDSISRESNRSHIELLLKDLAKTMDIFRKIEDDWFLDI